MEKVSVSFDPYGILLNAAIKQTEESLGRPLLTEELTSVKQSIRNLLNPSLDIDDSCDEINDQPDNSCGQSFDLKEYNQLVLDAFRQNVDNCKSEVELYEYLNHVARNLSEAEKKAKQIEQEDQINRLAHDIRMVVVGSVTIKHEPYSYVFKKHYPLLKEAHSRIIAKRKTALFLKSVSIAKKDMFQGDFKIYEYPKDMRRYFEVYTDNPLLFNISAILDFLSPEDRMRVQDLVK